MELSPNVAAILISGAQEEAREELAELWARLLANAMDPKLNNVRYSFIEAVKQMDPVDAVVLKFIFEGKFEEVVYNNDGDAQGTISIEEMVEVVPGGADRIELSLRYLAQLGLFSEAGNWANLNLRTNANFREFMRACYPELNSK